MAKRPYVVTFTETLIVNERVFASNAKEAVQLILDGEGERLSVELDDMKGPTRLRAERETRGEER